MIRLDYDDLCKIEHLNQRRADLDRPFVFSTCCDYVDSLDYDGTRYSVTMFVEPCGNITKKGTSWGAVLDWWIAVFLAQPPDWGYCRAGWHLYEMEKLPEDPTMVWPIEGEKGEKSSGGVGASVGGGYVRAFPMSVLSLGFQ